MSLVSLALTGPSPETCSPGLTDIIYPMSSVEVEVMQRQLDPVALEH